MNNPISQLVVDLRHLADEMEFGAEFYQQAVAAGDDDATRLHLAVATNCLDTMVRKNRTNLVANDDRIRLSVADRILSGLVSGRSGV